MEVSNITLINIAKLNGVEDNIMLASEGRRNVRRE